MGLFDKKFCDICGGKIGLLGNRKLEDGNLCKECAAKLSPWFSERRHSTLDDIKAQLADREANKALVEAFRPTRTIGEYYTVYIDEDAKRFLVSSVSNYRTENPDVLELSQVTGCDLDIDEHKTEVKYKDREGHMVSYTPARYDYNYDFSIVLRVNHRWFDEMRFRLNRSTVQIEHGSRMPAMGTPIPQKPVLRGILNAAFSPETNAEYNRYVAMGNEIKETLLQLRQAVREDIAAANAPKTAVICPACGASTIPDANGCCEFCGSAVR